MSVTDETNKVRASIAFLKSYTNNSYKACILPTQEWEVRFDCPITQEEKIYKSSESVYDLYKSVISEILK